MKTAAIKGFLWRCGDSVKGVMLNGTFTQKQGLLLLG